MWFWRAVSLTLLNASAPLEPSHFELGHPETNLIDRLPFREITLAGGLARASIVQDRILLRHGYEVVPVENGQLALEALRTRSTWHPLAILVDGQMPVMDGESFLRALHADHPELTPKTILISGGSISTEFHRLAGNVVSKPLDWVKLLTALLDLQRL